MKATGIIRKVDELGRIVIPIELRRMLDVDTKDAMEIFVNNDTVVLKKYSPACIFCGKLEGIKDYLGKKICGECLDKIKGI